MAERSKCDLPYGHYGRVQFSIDDSNLEFGRLLTTPHQIRALGQLNTWRRASAPDLPKDSSSDQEPHGKRYQKQTQNLLKNSPEFQPVTTALPSLLRTSEAVQRAAGRHEPIKGNLLAFVKVWSEIRHRSISVAAIATGISGSDLRLVQVQRHRRGWSEDKGSWLEVPILHGEEATWSSDAGPILQIVATSRSGSRDSLLAVRLMSKTHIFRPVHRKVPQENAPSNLALERLFTVDINDTEGRRHADVAFNPWFVQQIAFVDDSGAWSVLEFKSRNFECISRSWHGTTGGESTGDSISPEDGWAHISWVLNLSTIMVCTRQSLALVTFAADGAAALRPLEIDAHGISWCLIDIKIMPGSRDSLAVLTRTHIVLYKAVENGSNMPLASVEARIRHFKSPEDLSLRLTTWVDEEDIFLALRSSLHKPVNVFRLRKGAKDRMICDAPFDLLLVGEDEDTNMATSMRNVFLQPLRLATKSHAPAERIRPGGTTRFYSLTALRTDYSVLEGICYRSSAANSSLEEHVKPPIWEKSLPTATQSRLRREEFVIQDEDSFVENDLLRSEPVARRARRHAMPSNVSGKTVDFELVSYALGQPSEPDKAIQELVVEVAAILRTRNPDTLTPMRTLYNMTQSEIATEDIQGASSLLRRALETQATDLKVNTEPRDDENRLQFKPAHVRLPGPSCLEDTFSDLDTTLASVHDQIISTWITNLPTNIPGWVRLAKANIAQRIAAETFLASRTLHLEAVKAPAVTQSQEDDHDSTQTWELPVRASEPVSQTYPTASSATRHVSQQSALPTPSPTATPSVITASSGSSISAAPELHRLSRYTVFQKPAPMVLPRPLVKVLSHWEIGEDPDNYDWLAASRNINQQEDNEVDPDMTGRERKRMQRRAQRHILRQRKEAAASQASQFTSSQATEILSASQPAALKVESQPSGMPASSQSQGPSTGAVAASQVVPGRFGGRPPAKKRRKQGF